MNSSDPTARRPQRLAILLHGGFKDRHGKTGLSLLRYRGDEVVAVIDAGNPGRPLRELARMSNVPDIKIVGSVGDALASKPTALAIGIAPSGGKIPVEWMDELRLAVRSGVSIWNGLHTRLAADPEIAAALKPGVQMWDMRQEPVGVRLGTGAARKLACKRVLFVGTDMAIGKMTAALEFDRVARARGFRSGFVATGQAGMMISGAGICLDAVRVDFASGAVEGEVVRVGAESDVVWVEGQGSLLNPASTATLPLLRGSQPTHLVVVHKAGMKHLQAFPDIAIPSLKRVVEFHEAISEGAGAFPRAKVVGIALNTWGMDEAAARAAMADAEKETGLPCTDAVRHGPGALLDAILPVTTASQR